MSAPRRSFRLTPEQRRQLQEEVGRSGQAPAEAEIRPRTDPDDRPLSPAQQRIWFVEQLDPGGSSYNMPGAIRLRGSLDAAALERSFAEIVRRHETLRTVFPLRGGEPYQEVRPAGELPLPVIDLSRLPASRREAEGFALAHAEGRRPFDLAAGPLFRLALFRLGTEDHLLLFVMHHIIGDGWSSMVLTRELGLLYDALRSGRAPSLPALPVQYADFAVWQRRRLADESLASHLAWWREELAGAPDSLDLPADWTRGAGRPGGSAVAERELSPRLCAALQALGQRHGATLFMTLLAAFGVQLHRYTGQLDLTVGTPVASRGRAEVRDLIGVFINTLVLRARLSEELSFGELLSRVRAAALGAYSHQDVPFERLVEELRPERHLDRTPLFQVLFALEGASRLELPGLAADLLELEVGRARFDLSLTLKQREAGMTAILVYDAALYRASTARRMLEHYLNLLEQAVRRPEAPFTDLLMLAPAERHQVLVEWSDAERDDHLRAAAQGGEEERLFAFVEHPGQAPRHPAGRRRSDARPADAPVAAPPRSVLEKGLLRVWREVLGIAEIGVHDDFFALGGDSLAAIRVISRLREMLRADVPLRLLFAAPTVAELALAVARRSWEEIAPAAPALPSHLVALPGGSWVLWRPLVLRGAGFPAEEVLRLAAPEAAAAADRVIAGEEWLTAARVQAREALEAARDDLDRCGIEGSGRWPVTDALHAVAAGKVPSPVALPEEAAAAVAVLRDAGAGLRQAQDDLSRLYEDASLRASQAIDRLAADPRFREAVTWQNRHAVETALDALARHPAAPGSRNKARRKHEELVASYLQRYCVKNDTIGFFGPLGYGELVDAGPAAQARPGRRLLDRREVFFENWPIDALAQKLSADPALRPWLAPRLKSSFHLGADGLLHQPFGKPVRPPERELRLLAACDGRRTARSLARELLAEPSLGLGGEDEVFALLDDLCRRRIVTWGLEVPLELHPDRTLEEQLRRIEVEDLREPALAALEELRRGRDAVARAAGDERALEAALRGLEAAFTRHTGLEPRHHQGQTYAARGLVYEDCRRAVEARFGPELLERLGPPMTLLLDGARWLAGELTRRVETRLSEIHAELRRRTGRDAVDSQVFYAQALASLFLKRERDACFVEAERAYQERWARVLRPTGAIAGRRLRFTVEELEERSAEAFGEPGPAWSLTRYFSPDVLIAASGEEALRRGDYEIVLGEVHSSNTLLSSCFVSLHPDAGELQRILAADAGDQLWVLPQLLKQSWTQRLNLGIGLPGFYQFQYADEPPSGPRSRVLPAGDVVIEEAAAGLTGRTRDGRVRFPALDLFSYYLTQECSAIAGSLLPPRAHAPRITIDSVVVSRERWRMAVAGLEAVEIEDRRERFLAVRRWARELGLPRFCFYKLSSEKKPCYLDLDSPLYVDLFAKLVRVARAASRPESLALSEMLPRIDQAWLADAGGNRFTSELRLVAREGAPVIPDAVAREYR